MAFEPMYAERPPWDIGHAQAAIVRLEQNGQVGRRVLDVGCGTGDNALYLAASGHEVVGVDAAPTAIRRAREKADAVDAPTRATFILGDVLQLPDLPGLGTPFDTAIDSGLFHTLGDDERLVFAASLAGVLRAGGSYHMLCFSEHEPGTFGPRRVTQREIRETFSEEHGWRVNAIEPARFETLFESGFAHAWLASITRLPAVDPA
jgi:cyclopropane fatty-acyl-phospholipid synthase-like methyltransferase